MYEQQNNRDRDQNDVFYAGVPSNKININQLPKWIRIFGYCAFGWIIVFSLIMIVGLILQ